MADIKDKQFSQLKENLENFGLGIEKNKKDKKHPLPANLTKKRSDAAAKRLAQAWKKAQDARTADLKAFDEYQKIKDEEEEQHQGDVRIIKGVYGPQSETLRDFGVQPEKKRKGRQPGAKNK